MIEKYRNRMREYYKTPAGIASRQRYAKSQKAKDASRRYQAKNRKHPVRSPLDVEKAKQLFAGGISIVKISKAMGWGRATIAKALIKSGAHAPRSVDRSGKSSVEKRRARRRVLSKNPHNRVIINLRQRMKELLVSGRGVCRQIGCTAQQLRNHLQSQFTKGMNWNNYGKWHVDHILPCASFDLTDERQMKICWNWQNLRPLWADANKSKGDTITHPQMALPITLA
jgi:hypothetical protein